MKKIIGHLDILLMLVIGTCLFFILRNVEFKEVLDKIVWVVFGAAVMVLFWNAYRKLNKRFKK